MVTVVVGVLLVLLVVGAPVAVAVLLAGALYLASPGVAVPVTMGPLRMVTSMDNFLLIAVPLFILTGELLSTSGMTQRMITLIEYLVGWLKAGLAQVNVAMSMFFGGISGLSMADAAAIGTVMIPSMKRRGYTPQFAAAVTGVSSVIGPVIPPSVPVVIYAVIAGTSIAGLFAAGIVPGVLLGLALMVAVRLWARGPRAEAIERRPFRLRGFGRASLEAIPALLAPVIILIGIFTGIFTATEASAVAATYVLLLGVLFYRSLGLTSIWEACLRTVRLTGVVLFIFAAAAIVSWAAGVARLPATLVGFISELGLGPVAVMIGLAALLIVVGMFLDPLAAMIILVPVIAPVGVALGIDPLQLGLLVVLTLSVGMVTPPVGYVLFIVAHLGEVKVERVIRELGPFLAVTLVVILLVITVPQVTTMLPELLLGD